MLQYYRSDAAMIGWGCLSLLLILFTSIYFYSKRSLNYWTKRNVPHKNPTILLGNLLDIFLSSEPPGKRLGELYNEFSGPYFGFFALHRPFLVLRDPNLIKNVLLKDFASFPNRFFFNDEKIDPVVANSLLGIQEPDWRPLRTKLSPIFTSGKIKMMFDLMKECDENLQNYLRMNLNKNVKMKEIASMYTTDVIATCVFGIKTNSFESEDSEFISAGKDLTNHTFVRGLKAFCYIFAPPLVKLFKLKFLTTKPVSFLGGVFLETIALREKEKFKRNDLIDIFIELKMQEAKDDQFKFDENRMIAQGIIFFLGGHDTTSSTIAFTLHELCINTDIQDRLRREIMEVIENYGDVTYEAVQEMKYLQMVVAETLRKYPLTSFLHRECVKDYKIKETGLVIEKGTPVVIPQHGLHYDPKYFPNPHRYDPERFNDENRPKIPAYVYLPFGDGPRTCIGVRFGLINTKLAIINILKNYRVERNSQTQEPLIWNRAPLLRAKNGVCVTLQAL